MHSDIIIVGGGAAGFFAGINIAYRNPKLKIIILEKNNTVLAKVKISGGGRCNVTNSETNIKNLIENYPRGKKELIGPFHNFNSEDLVKWFKNRGIKLKTEWDGRIFPESNSSSTIVDLFINEAKKLNIKVFFKANLLSFEKKDNFIIKTENNQFTSDSLIITTGSNNKIWEFLKEKGHNIIPPVPSLFSFNIKNTKTDNLMGISRLARVNIVDSNFTAEGNLLFTHTGLSGPAILKLSSFASRFLYEKDYKFKIKINWCIAENKSSIIKQLLFCKKNIAKKNIIKSSQFNFSKRMWYNFIKSIKIDEEQKWADLNNKQLDDLVKELTADIYLVEGKFVFKEEFVTSGGIDLKEIDLRSFESKKHNNLYFAGEVLNIDAVTGGFNFQNAWTGAYIISKNF